MSISVFVEKMLGFAKSRGLLEWYEQDLTKLDADYMARLPNHTDWLWFVGKTHSDVVPLGIHKRSHEVGEAILQARLSGGSDLCVCRVNPVKGTIREITPSDVPALLRAPTWKVVDTVLVDPSNRRRGYLTMEFKRCEDRVREFGVFAYHEPAPNEDAFLAPPDIVSEVALQWGISQRGFFTSVVREQDYMENLAS